jgi:hypothetical protein
MDVLATCDPATHAHTHTGSGRLEYFMLAKHQHIDRESRVASFPPPPLFTSWGTARTHHHAFSVSMRLFQLVFTTLKNRSLPHVFHIA